jgi:hypothetical protein
MASSRSDPFPLTSWLIQYVEESSETNFIDLTEIKSKFQSDVLVEVPSSRTIGNLITKLFHGVKIKPGRCKDNWAKSTQRYYGLSWCKNPVTMQLLILTIWLHFYHLIFLLFQIPQTILLWDISPVIL